MKEFTGTLKLVAKANRNRANKKTEYVHTFCFVNDKGKNVEFPVYPERRHYVVPEDAGTYPAIARVEGSQVFECVVPGKEAKPAAPKPKNSENSGHSQGWQNQGRSSGNSGAGMAREPVWGMAPYNFVEYKPNLIAAPVDEPRRWQGRIRVSLKAETPLLVSGGSQKAREEKKTGPAECRFMKVDGKPVIPGSSLKGMLRSLMEILSFSGMRPMNKEKLFWRVVIDQNYRNLFEPNPSKHSDPMNKPPIYGGFLHKDGADYKLELANVAKVYHSGRNVLETGRKVGKDNSPNYYKFEKTGKSVSVERDLVNRLWRQMTDAQRKLHPAHACEKELKGDGMPVIYRLEGDKIAELGFCRYFRLEYRYSPFDLAWPGMDGKDVEAVNDICREIFGRVDNGARRGRVAVQACRLDGREKAYKPVVLGTPKPTCLPFYLDQDVKDIKLDGTGNNLLGSMKNYNDKKAKLRGRKLYWHHDVVEDLFPEGNQNDNVSNILHPLDKGAEGSFDIFVDHLTDTELGCLFEALELAPESRHKLGMGKSLGFGSIKLEIESAKIEDCSKKYSSLAGRLQEPHAPERDEAWCQNLRDIFRKHVFNEVKEAYKEEKPGDFYALPPIQTLFLMLNWEKRPKPDQVATMKLQPCFSKKHALLPDADEVARKKYVCR